MQRSVRTYDYTDHDGLRKEARHNLTDNEIKEAAAVVRNLGALMIPGVGQVRATWPSGMVRGVCLIDVYWFATWYEHDKLMYLGYDDDANLFCAKSLKEARLTATYHQSLRRVLRHACNHA